MQQEYRTAPSRGADSPGRLGLCVREGLRAGLRTALWLLSLMLPISLGVSLLHWSGLLERLTHWLGPLFPLIGLPPEAALPVLAGGLVNCYTGIAAMGSLPLSGRQVTILALMILVSHNLVVEVAVQRRAGSSGARILLLRLLSSAVAGFVLHRILPPDHGAPRAAALPAATEASLGGALLRWVVTSGALTAKIVVLVTCLMILERLIHEYGVDRWLARTLAPALRVLGLPPGAAFLWVVANTLGLAYGAGVLLEEVRTGALVRDDAELLNRSVAVCHSLLEDTLLFIAAGASALWITVPRLVLAAAAVWARRAWLWARARSAARRS